MGKHKPAQSALWENINRTVITQDQVDLANFKSSPVNFKIALWSPYTNGVRYLKTIIYNICTSLTEENWRRISRIKNRHLGNPFAVKYRGEEICLDYLQAVHELEFIEKSVLLDDLNILEVGAGYGRTCHTIMSNHDIKAYYIVDLENCLRLSRKYLQSVLDDARYSKIKFIAVEDIDSLENVSIDLCINIDSFSEMDAKVVYYYLDYVDKHSHYLYVKNPVGKYLDKSLDNHSQGNEIVQIAISTGILRDIIDIHDSEMVKTQAEKFISAYRPGNGWECISDSWAVPWSYYWQAIYRKARVEKR